MITPPKINTLYRMFEHIYNQRILKASILDVEGSYFLEFPYLQEKSWILINSGTAKHDRKPLLPYLKKQNTQMEERSIINK